jgi:glucan phosphoethanolaminetransferase (alkaline phosphatase superfamily)
VYAPGVDLPANAMGDQIVAQLAGGSEADVDALVADSNREIDAISDDAPFFWHFHDFPDVLGDIFSPLNTDDPEDVIGERVLLLMLTIAVAYAAVFLLLPFVAVRRTWRALPAKGASGVYFAALGLGFMFFEITMIQRLVLFLGYPTYSLTVTLASILVFTGIGALASRRLAAWRRSPLPLILAALAGLTVFYRFGLDPITESLLSSSLGVRVLVAVLLLAPLGVCLGMFMPLGLATVSRLTDHGDAYAAWGWAINGFFSVIGSVLTTILSMSFGFRAVQLAALAIYGVAVLAFVALRRSADRAAPQDVEPVPPADEVPMAVLAPASASGPRT